MSTRSMEGARGLIHVGGTGSGRVKTWSWNKVKGVNRYIDSGDIGVRCV